MCFAPFSRSKSKAQEQVILDPRNRISIPSQTSQSIVGNRSQKTAEPDPVAVLRMQEVTVVGPAQHRRRNIGAPVPVCRIRRD